MRGMGATLGLLIALGGGYFVYQKYMTEGPVQEAPPQQQIDVVGIRGGLLSIGQAERQYLIAHGNYGTLEEIRQENPTINMDQRGYVLSATVNGSQGFTVTATPADAGKSDFPTLTITETMQVTQQ